MVLLITKHAVLYTLSHAAILQLILAYITSLPKYIYREHDTVDIKC